VIRSFADTGTAGLFNADVGQEQVQVVDYH
jgi:hypothetical protein